MNRVVQMENLYCRHHLVESENPKTLVTRDRDRGQESDPETSGDRDPSLMAVVTIDRHIVTTADHVTETRHVDTRAQGEVEVGR